ncbi:hypothetical protein HPB52_007893 [Rhipicephalus sanguineus]|uniref:Uncharacterized protein n=1 Tax=Rhipicephalus sanguineus TaxID=34632 RepID=A0A9D4PVA7_RHISA|nr:hypothetical protein HPB52_007893 [Rhipicephalus sanguineus]
MLGSYRPSLSLRLSALQSAQVLDLGVSLNEILLRGPRDRERLVEPEVLLGLDRSLTRPLEFERLLDLELERALGFLE